MRRLLIETRFIGCLFLALGVTGTGVLGDYGDPDGLINGPFPPTEPHPRFSVSPDVTVLPAGAVLVDYVDIGDPSIDPYGFGDESAHLLEPACPLDCSGTECGTGTGDSWGPVCSWSDASLRAIWECGMAGTTSESATINMDFGPTVVNKYIALRWQGGAADDSFSMEIAGNPGVQYQVQHLQAGSNACFNIGVWDVGILTGVQTLTLTATASAWASQEVYGQVMISEIAVWEGPSAPSRTVEIDLVALSTPSSSDSVGFTVCMSGLEFGQPCNDDSDCTFGGEGACRGLAELPVSETQFEVGETLYLEMWAQTTNADGLAAVYADVHFDPCILTATQIFHSMAFTVGGFEPVGAIDNAAGLIDDVGGPHLDGQCTTEYGFEPMWVRVAYVEFTVEGDGAIEFSSSDTGSGFGSAICGTLGVVDPEEVEFGEVGAQAGTEAAELVLDVPGAPVVVQMGEEVDVMLKVANLTTAINGVQALIHYDDSVLSLVGIIPAHLGLDKHIVSNAAIASVAPSRRGGTQKRRQWGRSAVPATDSTDAVLASAAAGWVEISESDVGGDIAYAAQIQGGSTTADGTVATLTFEAVATGTPVISFLPNRPPAHPTLCTKVTDASNAQAIFPVKTDTHRGDISIGEAQCFIDGEWYDAGELNPEQECEWCVPSVGGTSWTPRAAGTNCGDAPDLCEEQDACDGAGECVAGGSRAEGTECRASVGECDVAEVCDGISAECPVDGFAVAGTDCGAAPDVCEERDTCDGAGVCSDNGVKAAGTECRPAIGECDVMEVCDGVSAACPADGFAVTGSHCGPAPEVCEEQDTCDGAGSCVDNGIKVAGTVCREAVGDCDATESCDGVSGSCPADAFLDAGVSCGSVLGPCDGQDTCDGTGGCVDTGFVAAGTECRAASGVCDVPEVCPGDGPECPVDAYAGAGVECRAAVGGCDVAEYCPGDSAECPTDSVANGGNECRAVAGACDVAEVCDGVAHACPADSYADWSRECRAVAGGCDVAEYCPGDSPDCPADVVVAGGTECRAVAGVCDVAEECDGVNAVCPADAFADYTTECRASSWACDPAEFCPGDGPDCPPDDPDSTYIDVEIEVGALTGAAGVYGVTAACPLRDCVTRDVTFIIGSCGGPEEVRIVPVTFTADLLNNVGVGYATLADVDNNAEWIQATEGHALSRMLPLVFDGTGGCSSAASFTGASRLIPGDYSNATVAQDNLVDITDFSILAIEWNQTVAADLGSLADATGDGVQDSFDFAPLQMSYAQTGDDRDVFCERGGIAGGGDEAGVSVLAGVDVWRQGAGAVGGELGSAGLCRMAARTRIAVSDLSSRNAQLADINHDGVIDASDIRAFADVHGLVLTPQFSARLTALELSGVSGELELEHE